MRTHARFFSLALLAVGLLTPGNAFAQGYLPDPLGTSVPLNGAVLDFAQQSDGRVIAVGRFTEAGGATRNRIVRYTVSGTLDSSFFVGTGANGPIHAVAVDPEDDSIYIGGEFTTYAGRAVNRIAKLRASGQLEPDFFPNGLEGTVRDLALSTFKLYAVGDFPGRVLKIDRRFGPPSYINGAPNGTVHCIVVEDAITGPYPVIGGEFTRAGGRSANYLAHLDRDLRVLPEPAALAGPNGPVYALAIDDLPEPPTTNARSRIVVGGNFSTYNGARRSNVAVVFADDTSYRNGRRGTLASNLGDEFNSIVGEVRSLAVETNGLVAIGGQFTLDFRPTTRNLVFASSLDGGFSGLAWNQHQPNETVRALAFQPDGMVLVGGDFTILDGLTRSRIARLYSRDGNSPPATPVFTAAGPLDSDKIALRWELPGNSAGILGYKLERRAAGSSWSTVTLASLRSTTATLRGLTPDTAYFFRLSAYNGSGSSPLSPDTLATTLRTPAYGKPDPAFFPANGASLSDTVAVDPRGRLVVGATFEVIRYEPDGTRDPEFTVELDGGTIWDLAIQADGRTVLAGSFATVDGEDQPYLARLLTDGGLDRSFSPTLDALVRKVELLPDGRILIAGSFHTINGESQHTIALLHQDGSLDQTFRPEVTGINLAPVSNVALAPDGTIVAGGTISSVNGTATPPLIKLVPTGELAPGFSLPADLRLFDVHGIAVQPNGQIVVSGTANPIPRPSGFALERVLRLNENGSADLSFGPDQQYGHPIEESFGLAILPMPDGSLVLSGRFDSFAGKPRFGLARLSTDGTLDPSFTGGCGLRFSSTGATGARELALLPDGRIAATGSFRTANDEDYPGTVILLDRPSFSSARAPTELTVASHPEGLLLRWSSRENQTGYLIERRPLGEESWSEIARVPAGWLSLVDREAPVGTTVEYRIRGIRGTRTSTAGSPIASGTSTLTPFQQWLQSFGLATDLDHGSDLDRDGWALFLEFALDWHPTERDRGPWFQHPERGNATFVIETPREDVVYTLEQSGDGMTWTSAASAPGGAGQRLEVTFEPATAGTFQVLRLRLSERLDP